MSSLHTIRFVSNALGAGALALALGLGAGCGGKEKAAEEPAFRIDAKRYKVPVFDDDLVLGGDQALVTVVMFSDYACPPCGTTWKLFKNLHEDYGDDVRFVYRTFTVPGFGQGERAADAALAAAAQGKFWDMHWRLFDAAPAFDRPMLRAQAEEIGLDVPKFLDDLDVGAHSGIRIRHRREAMTLGIRGLPVMFVNGLYMVGGQTDESGWHELLDAEILRAREMVSAGTPREKIYEEIMSRATRGRVPGHESEKELREDLDEKKAQTEAVRNIEKATGGERYEIRPGAMPARGPEDAPVVVVEFLDFACPFCRRAWKEDVAVVMKEHGSDVKLAIRHYPLEIHATARGTAEASVAAHNQGKFWEFHDRMIEREGTVGRDVFERVAGELGMDVEKFRKDLDDPATKQIVADDLALGRKVGVAGTPGFFVNGRYIRGVGNLPGAIEEELKLVEAQMKAGVPRAEVAELMLGQAIPESKFPNP